MSYCFFSLRKGHYQKSLEISFGSLAGIDLGGGGSFIMPVHWVILTLSHGFLMILLYGDSFMLKQHQRLEIVFPARANY